MERNTGYSELITNTKINTSHKSYNWKEITNAELNEKNAIIAERSVQILYCTNKWKQARLSRVSNIIEYIGEWGGSYGRSAWSEHLQVLWQIAAYGN